MDSQFQSQEDSLRFQIEEDLDTTDPTEGVHCLYLYDVGSGLVEGFVEGKVHEGEGSKEDEGQEGEGEEVESFNYGSTLEIKAIGGGTESEVQDRSLLRSQVCEFLRSISDFAAQVLIWSSMKRTTIEQIARFLFYDLPAQFAILDENRFTNIEIGDDQFVFSFNENKLIFLKIML